MTPQTKTILIWVTVIGVIGIGGYATYAAIQKKKEEAAANKPKISAADAESIGAGLGSLISNIFKKKSVSSTAPVSTGTTNTTGLDYPCC